MFDPISYSKALSIQNSVVSGWKSVYLDSQTGTVTATDNDGNTYQYQYPLPKDGKSIESARFEKIDDEIHLILVRDDKKEIDVGVMPSGGGDAVLSADFTANVAIGQVKKGTKYLKDTPLENIIKDMLTEKIPPTITSFAIVPNKTLYDKVEETLSDLTFNLNIKKNTNDISSIKVYIDNALVKEWNTSVSGGGVFNYQHTFSPATNKDNINLKVVVTDSENLTAQSTKDIQFVGKSYWGYVAETVGEPQEADILALQNRTLKTTKNLEYKGFTFAYDKVVYAYPKNLGALTQIKDVKNNIPYTDSFTRREVTVNGLAYYCYTLNEPTGANDNELTFS